MDDSHITAIVPNGSRTVQVTVQSGIPETDPNNPSDNVNNPIFGYGTSATSAADQFTYGGPAPGQSPTINPIGSQAAGDGGTLSFTVTAAGPGGAPLTFSLAAGAPQGASINAQTGLFTWTPSEWNGQAPGVYSVTVLATESIAPQLVSSVTFSVTVGPSSTNQGSGQAARTTVAEGVSQSAEYYTNIITAAYDKYLGRAPDAVGLAYWLNLMQNQGLTDEKLEAGFIGSQEYIQDHGGTGPNWITGLYVDLLGRTPAPSEVLYWVNNLNDGMSPVDIAYGFAATRADVPRDRGLSAIPGRKPLDPTKSNTGSTSSSTAAASKR